jgi:hypothetical protein
MSGDLVMRRAAADFEQSRDGGALLADLNGYSDGAAAAWHALSVYLRLSPDARRAMRRALNVGDVGGREKGST